MYDEYDDSGLSQMDEVKRSVYLIVAESLKWIFEQAWINILLRFSLNHFIKRHYTLFVDGV